MAVLPILEDPDPRLRMTSEPVDRFDVTLARLADDLIDTLHATGGIGLSAPQVDERQRVVVMDLSGDASAPEVYVNPVLLARSTPGLVEESCFSLPGIVGNVVRATEIRVEAQGCDGQPFGRALSGMEAVCLQHEIDHLDGRLFVDRLSFLARLRLRMTSRTFSRPGRNAA